MRSESEGKSAEVFWAFLKLGLTSFGGPVAHIGYFRSEFVARRKWVADDTFADLLALCQFLPGPASSQLGIAIGTCRAGYPGGLAAWIGFTLPSAIALVLFALGLGYFGSTLNQGWLHGLKVAAVAVVALAVLGMARALAPDRPRATLAVVAMVVTQALPSAWGQILAIAIGAVIGILLLRSDAPRDHVSLPPAISRTGGVLALTAFFILLVGLPIVAAATDSHGIKLFDTFFRAGSLVFGGGHVVLPLLQAAVVPPGWVSNDAFLAGYGAAQAVPGPLFTFAAYLGAIMTSAPNGWAGAALCLGAIFLPSFLLVFGVLPFWDAVRRRVAVQAALKGVNAAVVGLLLAALYNPVWTAGILNGWDFALATGAFLLLFIWKTPPWLVVFLCGIGGAARISLMG
jgi:chromate transporter